MKKGMMLAALAAMAGGTFTLEADARENLNATAQQGIEAFVWTVLLEVKDFCAHADTSSLLPESPTPLFLPDPVNSTPAPGKKARLTRRTVVCSTRLTTARPAWNTDEELT